MSFDLWRDYDEPILKMQASLAKMCVDRGVYGTAIHAEVLKAATEDLSEQLQYAHGTLWRCTYCGVRRVDEKRCSGCGAPRRVG
jgi:rubrerythrin